MLLRLGAAGFRAVAGEIAKAAVTAALVALAEGTAKAAVSYAEERVRERAKAARATGEKQ